MPKLVIRTEYEFETEAEAREFAKNWEALDEEFKDTQCFSYDFTDFVGKSGELQCS